MLEGFFGSLEHYVREYGYLAVTLGILLEDFGMPTPGETLLIIGGIAASDGKLSIYLLLPLAWVGAVVGDNIGFLIGQTGGHRLLLRYGRKVGITDERLQQVERAFDRYGPAVVLFARFVVVLRQFNGIVAGTLEMHWLRFFLLNMAGAALWVGFWGMAAYLLGHQVLSLLRELHALRPVLIAIALLVVVGGVAYLGWRYWRRRT